MSLAITSGQNPGLM